MRKTALRLIGLLLTLSLLLSGCASLQRLLPREPATDGPSFYQLPYSRPTRQDLQVPLDRCKQLAQTSQSADALADAFNDFCTARSTYMTACSLAELHYYSDMTDSYWREECNYCTENLHLADTMLEELYYAYAKSPLVEQLESEDYFGAGFFDAYQGPATGPDPQLVALLEQEAECINQYYQLLEDFDGDCSSYDYRQRLCPALADLYARLIGIRQQMASLYGYDSFADYAYQVQFGRSYTPRQAQDFLEQLQQQLVPIYRHANQNMPSWQPCSQEDIHGYVQQAALNMGGDIAQTFRHMDSNRLYDIAYSEKKYELCYEIYLWAYETPVIFLYPYNDQLDKLSFAHEYGHFMNDYLCGGSLAGIDVAEVHSQAFTYLTLCYTDQGQQMLPYAMYDSLSTFAECSAYASFEQQAHALTGQDLTGQTLMTLAQQVALDYGFDSWGDDGLSFFTVSHFYSFPMYTISYVVSNDLAMQIYQQELESPGQGLATYRQCLYSEDSDIVAFALDHGLSSPFAPGRAESVSQILQQHLGS